MTDASARTPLHGWHVEHGGRMVDFAGWSMPVQYTSIVDEHRATRSAAGVFDVSHMGRLRFAGPAAAQFLDQLLTRRVTDLAPGQIRYSLIVNEDGGILDDVLVSHLETPGGGRQHLLVVNAGNRAKIVSWIQQHVAGAGNVASWDQTQATAMIAVQGPHAERILAPLLQADLSGLAYYSGIVLDRRGRPWIVTRTGYTGEDGFELIVPAEDALDTWNNVLRSGRELGVAAAGLGARDTLRLEAAMPLYGHELSEAVNPYQAGLAFAVNLRDRDFVGRDALLRLRADPQQPRRVGLELMGRRVPREHCAVWRGDQPVGTVTSGTFAPTLQKPIAMAYVPPDCAASGAELAVEIRGRREPARQVRLPFYTRGKAR
jgi:aminomethyltransferase